MRLQPWAEASAGQRPCPIFCRQMQLLWRPALCPPGLPRKAARTPTPTYSAPFSPSPQSIKCFFLPVLSLALGPGGPCAGLGLSWVPSPHVWSAPPPARLPPLWGLPSSLCQVTLRLGLGWRRRGGEGSTAGKSPLALGGPVTVCRGAGPGGHRVRAGRGLGHTEDLASPGPAALRGGVGQLPAGGLGRGLTLHVDREEQLLL